MATDYLSALNAGSGLNVPQIVDALVDAERVPKQKKIDEATETATVKISALGSLKNELSVFQTNANALDGQIGPATVLSQIATFRVGFFAKPQLYLVPNGIFSNI